MKETVEIWIEEFKRNGSSAEDEIEEINCAISNEKLWAKGSDGEAAEQHLDNVETLEEYLEWLKEHK